MEALYKSPDKATKPIVGTCSVTPSGLSLCSLYSLCSL